MKKPSHVKFTNTAGEPLELVLYMFDTCPFCQRVLQRAEELSLALPMRDIRKEPAAWAELLKRGGKTTVPCLFINGKAMYESADIIDYLENDVRGA